MFYKLIEMRHVFLWPPKACQFTLLFDQQQTGNVGNKSRLVEMDADGISTREMLNMAAGSG